jgi:protein-S-isoprenylcysteine O-methyltransferase Ste14
VFVVIGRDAAVWYRPSVLAKACAGIAFALFVHLWWRSAGLSPSGPFWVALSAGPAVVWDLALLGLFYGAHSGFASLRFKRWIGLERETTRKLYLVLTLPVTLAMWALWVPLPAPVLWDVRGALDIPFLAVRVLALAGLVWTVRSFSLPDFFGDRASDAPGDHAPDTPASGSVRLSTGGAFALCRHPLYLFMSLLAAATTLMPLGRALMAGTLVIYVAIGSRLEEIKLEREFGPAYARYRARTPWLIPTPTSIARAWPRRRLSRDA